MARGQYLLYKKQAQWSDSQKQRADLLFNYYPDSKNALKEPAIVLIDEIDLHLHPSWQLDIVETLSNHFPNIQFIATAHSPLMVQSALNANFAVLKFEDGSVHVVNDPVDIDGWRVDQILTSEFFQDCMCGSGTGSLNYGENTDRRRCSRNPI